MISFLDIEYNYVQSQLINFSRCLSLLFALEKQLRIDFGFNNPQFRKQHIINLIYESNALMTKHLGYGWLEFTGGVSEFTGGVSLILYCMNENHCE